jgi:hypothetical protein
VALDAFIPRGPRAVDRYRHRIQRTELLSDDEVGAERKRDEFSQWPRIPAGQVRRHQPGPPDATILDQERSRAVLVVSDFSTEADAYRRPGKTGDGGIDGRGFFRVGLVGFPVVFQCKRYQGSVGSSTVRDFRGAMSRP